MAKNTAQIQTHTHTHTHTRLSERLHLLKLKGKYVIHMISHLIIKAIYGHCRKQENIAKKVKMTKTRYDQG